MIRKSKTLRDFIRDGDTHGTPDSIMTWRMPLEAGWLSGRPFLRALAEARGAGLEAEAKIMSSHWWGRKYLVVVRGPWLEVRDLAQQFRVMGLA